MNYTAFLIVQRIFERYSWLIRFIQKVLGSTALVWRVVEFFFLRVAGHS